VGHIRLGRLPKTRPWRSVVGLLAIAPMDVGAVAEATAEAAEVRLRLLALDATLSYSFWLLTRVTWAARTPAFASSLIDLGLEPVETPSPLTLIAQLGERVRARAQEHPESGPFAELSLLALRRALSETVGQERLSLFGSTIEDLRQVLRPYSTAARFGTLAKRFFGDLLARTLRFFVDRELSNRVGGANSLQTIADSMEFTEALDLYARQTAVIMEQYGADWYSKYNWQDHGEIPPEEARRFVAYALGKLRAELKQPEP
jgi:hypothetical protein